MNHTLALPLMAFVLTAATLPATAAPPAVGEKAPDFALSTVEGRVVRLSSQYADGPVVLVVLRGYPGYQCPFCTRQVQDFLQHAANFGNQGARLLLVYPGPGRELGQRASEFLGDRKIPENFVLVLDPDYAFTNRYGLRWDAPHETAYPATFVIDKSGTVTYQKISNSHGDRTKASDILGILSRSSSGR